MSTSKEIISLFFREVRSGKNLRLVYQLMHEEVFAHQIQSEHEYTITRTPDDYIEHVKEMQELYGQFELEVQEILQEECKVYVRWKQTGFDSAGRKIIQLASAVYLVEEEKISEYWIQIDRKGIELQNEIF